jgi:branched-chain amino acid aminotransferase
MNRSAARLCMPALDVPFVVEALKTLVGIDREWVPRSRGASLYVRPTMIATGASLGVKVSPSYLFFIMTGPVGPYYPGGFQPTRIMVTDEYSRSVPGGLGEAKTAGNYAASLKAAEEAHAKGYSQVLWLDGVHRRFVEEVGTSNIFFVIDGEMVTPPLRGTILPGITRDSVIQLAGSWGMTVRERPIDIDEVADGLKSGRISEIFASGTAAVISPVGALGFHDRELPVSGGNIGEVSRRLYDELTGIQYGDRPDPFGWVVPIG